MIYVAPSILAADFACLGNQVRDIERAGAQRIHIDIMDGHFVPNLSMGPNVVKALRPVTRLPLEVHLMIDEPGKFVDDFLKEGADTLIAHWEVLADPRPIIRQVRERGKKVGLAIKPETMVDVLEPFLSEIDVALCMTVHPGFGGQSYLPESPERIRRLRQLIDQTNRQCDLEVDGGIDFRTGPLSVQAGANVLVAGTAIFGHARGPAVAVTSLRELVNP
ncbi:MAG TPA: ribulose-phosphate 3-epimerase [Gemmataceae bacterium]|nr:ribulose-phosphate 3-epimerase [Gemmataceae bacterium]